MRHNIYLPDKLSKAVQEAGISLSAVCQRALEQEVRRVQTMQQASTDLAQVVARLKETRANKERLEYQDGYELGVRWAKERATEAELEWASETSHEHWVSVQPDPDNSLWEFLVEEERVWEGVLEGKGGHYEREPFMVGVFEGASEVYRQVTPLL